MCQDVVMIVPNVTILSPESGDRMLSANQRSESSQGDQWGHCHISPHPGPRDMWCVTHGRGVTWQGGVTPCDTVLTGATYQLLLQSDWLTADKCLILLADKKRRSRGSQVRCEERSEWRVNILNNLTLISLNQSLLHLELKEFWRFANKKLIWCLPWPIRDHSRVIILVSGLIWIKANLDEGKEQEEAMREAFAFSFNWSQARFVAFFSL